MTRPLPTRVLRAVPMALALSLLVVGGCQRSKLSHEAFEAPVTQGAVPQTPGDTVNGDGSGPVAAVGNGDQEIEFSEATETFCAVVNCTFHQSVNVERAMEDARISRTAGGDHAAAWAKLAEAFRGGRLDLGVVQAYYLEVDPPDDDGTAQLARLMSTLHGLLDADQREALALAVSEQGPREPLGQTRRPGGRGKASDDATPSGERPARAKGRAKGQGNARLSLEERHARQVDRACEVLECTEQQRAALVAKYDAIERQDHDTEIASMNLRLAVLLRRESAPPEAVERQMRVLRDMNHARDAVRAKILVAVHEILSPEQRQAVAEDIEQQGPGRALGLRGRSGARGAANTPEPDDGEDE